MIHVPLKIMNQIRQHAGQCRPDREVVGILGLKDGVVVAYVKARNASKMPGRFLLRNYDRINAMRRLPLGCDGHVLLHTHPNGSANPSYADLSGANSEWLGEAYAIYSVKRDELKFHELARDRSGYREYGLASGGDWKVPRG